MRFRVLTRWYVYGPIAVLLLGFVVYRARPADIIELLQDADLRLIGLAILLNLGVIGLWAIRSSQLLEPHGHHIDQRSMILLVTFANTASTLTPASTGEVFRAVLLERRHGIPLATGAAVIVVERVLALYLLALSTAVAWLWLVADPGPLGGSLLVIGATLLAFAPTASYRFGLRPVGRIGEWLAPRGHASRLGRLGDRLVTVDERIAGSLTGIRQIVLFTLATLGVFVIFAAQMALVAAAIGSPIGLLTGWAVQGIAVVVGVLSAVPFGLGPADAAVAVLLPSLGVNAATAAVIALLFRAVSTLPMTALGVASYVLLFRRVDEPRPAAPSSLPRPDSDRGP